MTGLVLAGTFLPGALRGSGSESEPVLPAAPVPSTSSRAVAHDGLVQFRNVAGLILQLPEGWQALEAPPGFGYDETPESVIPPGASTAPPDEAKTAPPDKKPAPPARRRRLPRTRSRLPRRDEDGSPGRGDGNSR
nr:hypothetical protein OH820_18435 [Streptomyces sp. NBC_00857]